MITRAAACCKLPMELRPNYLFGDLTNIKTGIHTTETIGVWVGVDGDTSDVYNYTFQAANNLVEN